MIYFITGSSGVGKSTLVKELKGRLPDGFAVYDFDEVGVPLDADQSWRLETTRKWIKTAKQNNLKNISTIIIGLIHPDEVNEIAGVEDVSVSYIMLEVENGELEKRLLAFRFSTPERIENLKKYEKVTPEEFFENNKRHVQKIKEEALRHDAIFIDTTHKSPESVAKMVIDHVLGVPDIEAAFKWIVGILQKHQIPFQISGGFAARLYGSTRELADIDIAISDVRMSELIPDVSEYISFGPARYLDEEWDLQLITLNYREQEIDIGGIDNIKIFDKETKYWVSMSRDIAVVETKEVYGISVPLIPKSTLIAYKKKLMRDVDRLDILAMENSDN